MWHGPLQNVPVHFHHVPLQNEISSADFYAPLAWSDFPQIQYQKTLYNVDNTEGLPWLVFLLIDSTIENENFLKHV